MANILGIGIATLDIINTVSGYPTEDSEVRSTKQKIARGGNATNTLCVLSQLQHKCYWAGTLAAEPDADKIISDLNQYSIDLSYVHTLSEGKVPTSYILLNQENGSRSIVHYRDLEELTFDKFKIIPLDGFDWLHFEGRNIEQSLMMLNHIKKNYPALPCSIEFEKVRPNIEQLYPLAETLIFSKNYCETRSGNDPEGFLKTLNNTYPDKTIILAWGEVGSYAISLKEGLIFSPSIKQQNVVDTLGAGDTFNAAVINAIIMGYSLKEVLDQANKLAAYKISTSGFNISNYE